jgi:hypothetical protein
MKIWEITNYTYDVSNHLINKTIICTGDCWDYYDNSLTDTTNIAYVYENDLLISELTTYTQDNNGHMRNYICYRNGPIIKTIITHTYKNQKLQKTICCDILGED